MKLKSDYNLGIDKSHRELVLEKLEYLTRDDCNSFLSIELTPVSDKTPRHLDDPSEFVKHSKDSFSSLEIRKIKERHGHDVPDESLIKRANEGIAPDGSNIGNPSSPVKPPYSSRFETSDQLKLALDNTRPGTPAFDAAPTNNGTKVVIHELTGGATYGKGVPRDGNVFETSTKVRAVYREVSPGNFQLLTMFPDF